MRKNSKNLQLLLDERKTRHPHLSALVDPDTSAVGNTLPDPVRWQWDQYDVDRNHELDREEVKELLAMSLGIHLSPQQLESLFSEQLDPDSTGVVSLEEFTRAWFRAPLCEGRVSTSSSTATGDSVTKSSAPMTAMKQRIVSTLQNCHALMNQSSNDEITAMRANNSNDDLSLLMLTSHLGECLRLVAQSEEKHSTRAQQDQATKASLHDQLATAMAQLTATTSELKSCKTEVESLRKERDALRTSESAEQAEILRLGAELSSAQQQIQELTSIKGQLEEDLAANTATMDAKCKDLSQRLEDLTTSQNDAVTRASRLSETCDRLNNEERQLQSELQNLQGQKTTLESTLTQSRDRVQLLETDLSGAQERIVSAQDEIAQLQATIAALSKDDEERVRDLESKCSALSQALQESEARLAAEHEALESELKARDDAVTKVEGENAALAKQLAEAQDALSEQRKSFSELQHKQEEDLQRSSSMAAQLESATTAELSKAQEELKKKDAENMNLLIELARVKGLYAEANFRLMSSPQPHHGGGQEEEEEPASPAVVANDFVTPRKHNQQQQPQQHQGGAPHQ